jgi:hypothetical protein
MVCRTSLEAFSCSGLDYAVKLQDSINKKSGVAILSDFRNRYTGVLCGICSIWKRATKRYILASSWTHVELDRTSIANIKTGVGHGATAEASMIWT